MEACSLSTSGVSRRIIELVDLKGSSFETCLAMALVSLGHLDHGVQDSLADGTSHLPKLHPTNGQEATLHYLDLTTIGYVRAAVSALGPVTREYGYTLMSVQCDLRQALPVLLQLRRLRKVSFNMVKGLLTVAQAAAQIVPRLLKLTDRDPDRGDLRERVIPAPELRPLHRGSLFGRPGRPGSQEWKGSFPVGGSVLIGIDRLLLGGVLGRPRSPLDFDTAAGA